MPERDYRPEELLAGADRPRPLAPALRQRLEGTLLAAATAVLVPEGEEGGGLPMAGPVPGPMALPVLDGSAGRQIGARPLPPALRHRLERSLGRRGPARWRGRWVVAAGLAAAVAVVVGTIGPGGKPGGTNTTGAQVAVGANSQPKAVPEQNARVLRAAPGSSAGGPVAARSAVGAPHQGLVPVPAPGTRLVRVVPASGPLSGGNLVVMQGGNLGSVDRVVFGEAVATGLEHLADGSLEVRAPRHGPGTVVVKMLPAQGSGPVLTTSYAYLAHGR